MSRKRLDETRRAIELALSAGCRTELQALAVLADVATRMGFTSHFQREHSGPRPPMELDVALSVASLAKRLEPDTPAHAALITLASFFDADAPRLIPAPSPSAARSQPRKRRAKR